MALPILDGPPTEVGVYFVRYWRDDAGQLATSVMGVWRNATGELRVSEIGDGRAWWLSEWLGACQPRFIAGPIPVPDWPEEVQGV